MLQYLINVTNTLLPTVLVMAMLVGFAFLYIGKKAFKYGFIAGVLAAAVLSALKLNTGFVVREYYDIVILAFLLPSQLLFIIFMFIYVKKQSFPAVLNILIFLITGGLVAYGLPDMLMYPAEFSVGMDNIYNTDFVFKITGYLIATLVSLLAGLALNKIVKFLPAKIYLPAFAVGILLLMGQRLLFLSYILLGRAMIPRYNWLMETVIFVGSRDYIFKFGMMVLAALLAIILYIINKRPIVGGDNPAQRRKLVAQSIRERRWCKTEIICLIFACLFITLAVYWNDREVTLSPPIPVEAVEGEIVFPLSKFDDGHLHRFSFVTENGVKMRFIVIKKPKAGYGVGLDACDICGPTGYYERKNQVVCILCDVVMNVATIGFEGGCNPVPLAFELKDGRMIIQVSSFTKDEFRFR